MASRYDASTLTRWLAVSRRDPAANSSFLYGVNSTRIFCRPTCPGRLARRSNVVFFDSQDQAFDAGYRPCKRCQPCTFGWNKESQGRALAHRARDMIVAAVENQRPWTVDGVARELNITGAHLHRQFKRYFNVTPRCFAASLKTKALVQQGPIALPQPQSGREGILSDVESGLVWDISFDLGVHSAGEGSFCATKQSSCPEFDLLASWDLDMRDLIDFTDAADDIN